MVLPDDLLQAPLTFTGIPLSLQSQYRERGVCTGGQSSCDYLISSDISTGQKLKWQEVGPREGAGGVVPRAHTLVTYFCLPFHLVNATPVHTE